MKDPRVHLAHLLEAVQRIRHYTLSGQEVFIRETLVQDAVIRNFEIIGEAAKRMPADFREAHPEIPWKLMAGFRDVLIHEYDGISLKQVWKIIIEELPTLQENISRLLPPLEKLEKELFGEDTSTP